MRARRLILPLVFAASSAVFAQTPSGSTSTSGTGGTSAPTGAGGHPCEPDKQAKKAAHEALHHCIAEWARDVRPNQPDPAGDCHEKLSTFIQAAKTLKQCHQQQKGTHSH
jgi:hypothetical protein